MEQRLTLATLGVADYARAKAFDEALGWSAALEVEETRRAVEGSLLEGRSFPQILLRVGWPSAMRTQLSASRRRDLSEVLIREDDSPRSA